MDGIGIMPGTDNVRQVLIFADTVDHLMRRNFDKGQRVFCIKLGNTAMANEIVLTLETEPGALMKALIQTADGLFINTGCVQFLAGELLKIAAVGVLVM